MVVMLKSMLSLGVTGTLFFAAFSSSSSYQLQNYGIGSGGTNNSASANYKLNASTGQVSCSTGSSATQSIKPGSIQVQQANVPPAPTLDNGSATYYNKLKVTINKSANDATDYTYAIAASSNSFATTQYVQADGTLGASAVYQSYAAWGSASGSFISGLVPATTYQVKVSAMQGLYTASAYGPIASSTTANPSLTFSITPSTISLGSLTAGNVITAGTNLSFGFATNAISGGAVYAAGLNAGLKSVGASYTIAAVNANLASSSEGYGLRGLTATQTSGGPFTLASPFNGAANNVGAPTTTYRTLYGAASPIVGGLGTTSVLAKAAATTPAASDYSETLTFIASASY